MEHRRQEPSPGSEVTDPKVPVIRCGHLESKKVH